MNLTWDLPPLSGIDARALSEAELQTLYAHRAWDWVGIEDYRRLATPIPALPVGWADWYKIGDELQ